MNTFGKPTLMEDLIRHIENNRRCWKSKSKIKKKKPKNKNERYEEIVRKNGIDK